MIAASVLRLATHPYLVTSGQCSSRRPERLTRVRWLLSDSASVMALLTSTDVRRADFARAPGPVAGPAEYRTFRRRCWVPSPPGTHPPPDVFSKPPGCNPG